MFLVSGRKLEGTVPNSSLVLFLKFQHKMTPPPFLVGASGNKDGVETAWKENSHHKPGKWQHFFFFPLCRKLFTPQNKTLKLDVLVAFLSLIHALLSYKPWVHAYKTAL